MTRRRDPSDLSPREAVQRFLNSRRGERSESSIQSYEYRLKLFVEWLEGVDVQTVGELKGYDFDEYENVRRGDGVASSTLNNEMQTIKLWVEYLAQIEAVDPDLAEKVHVPQVPDADKSDDVRLEPDDAIALLSHFRDDPGDYGSRSHAWLELAWHTGARLGGLRALDLRDFDPENNLVKFRHRPDTGTPLKNGRDGERMVAFPDEVSDAVEWYVDHSRRDVHDDQGRQPLFTSDQGRPSQNTVRVWSYLATFPCHHGPCPHGREIETCEFRSYNQARSCPSSRSPHKIRTGSITWQKNLGFPPEVVAERVNASLRVIERHYDKASQRERLENRRRPFIDQMQLDQEDTDE